VTLFDSTRLSSSIRNLSSGSYNYCHTGVIYRRLFISLPLTTHRITVDVRFWLDILLFPISNSVANSHFVALGCVDCFLRNDRITASSLNEQHVKQWKATRYRWAQFMSVMFVSLSSSFMRGKLICVHLLTFLHTYVLACTCIYIYPVLSNGVEMLQMGCNIFTIFVLGLAPCSKYILLRFACLPVRLYCYVCFIRLVLLSFSVVLDSL
jgi:hypothetical protein